MVPAYRYENGALTPCENYGEHMRVPLAPRDLLLPKLGATYCGDATAPRGRGASR